MQRSCNAESNMASSLHQVQKPHLKNGNVYKDVCSCLLQQAKNMTPMHLPQHAEVPNITRSLYNNGRTEGDTVKLY
jgi:hypothetical protein